MRKDKKSFMILSEDLPAFGKPNSGTSRSPLRFHLVSLILVDVSSVSGLSLIWSKLILTLTSFLINTFLFNDILSDLKQFDNNLIIISCLFLSNLIMILKSCLINSCLIIVYYSLCLQANLSLLNMMIVKVETLISHPKWSFLFTEDHDNQKDYKVLHVQLLRYPISTCVVNASEAWSLGD